MSDGIVRGGCLCGRIRYEFDRNHVLSAGHCHCRDCQKATGSGKATIIFLPTDALKIDGEYKAYTVVGSEGSHVTRGFCVNCGCPIISYTEEDPGTRFIKAGSLDDPSWVVVQSSFWGASAHAWSPVDPQIPNFAGNPS